MTCICIVSLAVCAAFSSLLTFVFQRCVACVLRRPVPSPPATWPGVTVLKPLKGLEAGLLDNLRSLGEQDYPNFAIIFGCEDPHDPVRAVVAQFISEFPNVSVRTCFGHPPFGLNPKVANLAHMAKMAQHAVYLVSDTSVRLQPGALRTVVSSLGDNVGLVGNIAVGIGVQHLGTLLDSLHMNAFVATSMAGAHVLGKHTVIIGKSMLMRREALERAGGWHGVRDVLAEDYVLGQRIEQAGFDVVLSPMPIYNVAAQRSLRDCVARHVRWAQMRRHLSPSYWGEMLLNPTPQWVGLLAFGMLNAERFYVAAAVVAIGVKIATDASLYRLLSGERMDPQALLWVIPKDCIMAIVWSAGAFQRTVVWRGHRARIGAGSTLTLSPAINTSLTASISHS